MSSAHFCQITRLLLTDAKSKLHHPDPLSLSLSLFMSSPRLNEEGNRKGEKERNEAQLIPMCAFLPSFSLTVYSIKIHSSFRTVIKIRVILLFFPNYCLQRFNMLLHQTLGCREKN